MPTWSDSIWPAVRRTSCILARRLIGANTSRGAVGVRSRYGEVELKSRVVRVGAFPISIDSSSLDQAARHRDIKRRAREIRAELGNPRKVLLGVDRLDYTKGIDVRLKAFSELLAEGRAKRDDTVLIQLATPSRERVDSYQQLRNDIERQVGHINGEYGEVGHAVVHYLHRPVPRDELIAFFVAADVMLVTPLRDGMNLVAKEYVACRSDLGGALVLSEFTGAVRRTPAGVSGQPARPRRRQGRHRGRAEPIRRRRTTPDAVTAPPGSRSQRRPLGEVVPRCARRIAAQ